MAWSDHEDTTARSMRGQITRNQGSTAVTPTTAAKPQLGAIGQFVDKAASVGRQAMGIAGGVGKSAAMLPVHLAQTTFKELQWADQLRTQPVLNFLHSRNSKQLDEKLQQSVEAYKSGKMSHDDYTKALQDYSAAQQDISHQAQKIHQDASPVEKTLGIADLAATVLSLGTLKLAEVGVKGAVTQEGKALSRGAIKDLVTEAATPFEKQVLKVPSIKALVIRNIEQDAKREAQMLAGETVDQYIVRNGRKIATDLLIKRPIVYQSNIGGAKEMLTKAAGGDYKGALTEAAWLGSQALEGGPLGAFAKVAGWAKGGLRKLAYGNESLLDAVSRRMGDGGSGQLARFITTIQKRAPGEAAEVEKNFRVWQEGYLRAANNDVERAADNVVAYFESQGINSKNLTASDIYKSYKNHRAADELLQDMANKGVIPGFTREEARQLVVVRADQSVRDNLAQAFKGVGPELQARLDRLNELIDQQPNAGWHNNELFMTKLQKILSTEQTGKDVARAIQAIDAAALTPTLPKRLAQQLADLGYTVAMPKGGRRTPFIELDDTRKLVTAAIKGESEVFDLATSAQPQLASMAGFLERVGLSPRASNELATRKLSESLVASLDNLGVGAELGLKDAQGGDLTKGGQVILSRLQSFMDNMAPSRAGNLLVAGKATTSAAWDVRQLTLGEIRKALKTDKSTARAVSRALMEGYRSVPLEFRGLGDKITDTLYAINPAQKYYSRIQSALRYTYNPFFMTQERAETKILSHAQASNLLWMKPAEYPGSTKQWLNAGVDTLSRSGIFESSLAGEAAADQVFGKVTASITQAQKRDLAGLAYDIAKSRGISLDELVNLHSPEVEDALRVVVQYGRKGFLASPLARTMNLAFFPMRYNLKVTQIAAQTLAKQPPAIQKAVLHSMFNMKDWLGSDEGIAWQAKHADAIQVFNWVTPINSIAYTFNLLGVDTPLSGSEGKDVSSWGRFGQLGGLPLGIITQLLDGQGLINLNRPYVNPKTGDVIPKYIPVTTKARAATALADLINTMFTYPGRILGLPGKSQAIRTAVQGVVKTNPRTDVRKEAQDDRLTPAQQNWVRVLQGDTSKEAIDSLYHAPAPGQFNWYTLPPLTVPTKLIAPSPQVERRTNLPTKASLKKAKTKKTAKAIAQPI